VIQEKEQCNGRKVTQYMMVIGKMTDGVALELTVYEKEQDLEKYTLVDGKMTKDM